MKEIIVLSSQGYEEKEKNCGDCVIINNNEETVIYDCGSEEHAKRVIEYMDDNKISKVKVILSHNDSDHFNGIPYLIEEGKISEVHTVLLLKYKDELLKRVDDKRRNRDSIGETIKDIYSNIAELSEKVSLKDIYEENKIASDITVVGPEKGYMLDAVAKRIDSREGDTIDKETIVNATSIQISLAMGTDKLLLCGDCSYAAIDDKVKEYSYIQLPHHGKKEQADEIFRAKEGENKVVYIVSDNTGNSNGGSDDLPKKGYDIRNTKNGDIRLKPNTNTRRLKGCYSVYKI